MYLILFCIGLAVGSFINVVSLRYQPGQKLLSSRIIGGRSHCPHCRQKLNWYELVPIFSFLIQKGRCRHCGSWISWQYPIVEILSGLIFVAIPWHLSNWHNYNNLSIFQSFNLSIVIWVLIFLLFLILAVIDLRHYLVPDQINLSLAILGIVLIIFQSFNLPIFQSSFLGHYALLFNPPGNIWLNHLFAALLSSAFFAAIILITRGRAMGWGDFKLAGALGLIFGWPDVLMVVALSFVIGSLFVLPLLIKGKKKMKDVVPFGPFLVVSGALTFFFGFQIIAAYFNFFNILY